MLVPATLRLVLPEKKTHTHTAGTERGLSWHTGMLVLAPSTYMEILTGWLGSKHTKKLRTKTKAPFSLPSVSFPCTHNTCRHHHQQLQSQTSLATSASLRTSVVNETQPVTTWEWQ